MVRIRISETRISDEYYKALIERTGAEGIIERKYISKAKQKEVREKGYARSNQPKERIC